MTPTIDNKYLSELWGEQAKEAMETVYPGLAQLVDAAVSCLYGAIVAGLMYEQQTGSASATGLWLRQRKPNVEKWQTYDRALDDFAALADFASHDAWLTEHLAKRGLDVCDLRPCPDCGGLVGLDCDCEGERME